MCRVLAQEEIQRFSDLFDTPGEIPQPEEFIKSESGRIYRLKKQELLTVPVVGGHKKAVGPGGLPGNQPARYCAGYGGYDCEG